MAIKVIVELQAKPGKRAELKSLLESVVATLGPRAPGFLGSTRYEVLDNPDILVEIADWSGSCPDERPVSPPNQGVQKCAFALPRPEWPISPQLRKSYQKERGVTWLLPAV